MFSTFLFPVYSIPSFVFLLNNFCKSFWDADTRICMYIYLETNALWIIIKSHLIAGPFDEKWRCSQSVNAVAYLKEVCSRILKTAFLCKRKLCFKISQHLKMKINNQFTIWHHWICPKILNALSWQNIFAYNQCPLSVLPNMSWVLDIYQDILGLAYFEEHSRFILNIHQKN